MPTLKEVVQPSADKLLSSPNSALCSSDIVLVVLAAGKGTRFGQQPKCIQPVLGIPLARRSVEAFRSVTSGPAICLVGYKHEEVAAALGPDILYIRSDNPTGGTAFATYEVFAVPGLLKSNPLLVVTMGDRVVPPSTIRRLLEMHISGDREADLTFLSARYEPPRHLGKGRVLRNEEGRVDRIIEERDIDSEPSGIFRQALRNLTEGNCPLYIARAATLHHHLASVTNANAQGQYYLTDIIASISSLGGNIRTVTAQPSDPDYDLLCADVTRPSDLALLEGLLLRQRAVAPAKDEIDSAVRAIVADRPAAQVASIARQLQEIVETVHRERLGCQPDDPVAIGISGGRLRIAFMHPDMSRFFGPAWQMPIGAGSAEAGEQIVVVAQSTNDHRLHLYPLDAKYRESINAIPADDDVMYPGAEIGDWHTYENFGTRMSESLLLSLGYFTDEEIETRRQKGLPLPPPVLRVASNMRRPFALVANTLASLRTLRDGHLGARVQQCLDRSHFTGLRILCTGNIPQGGFSSSSALTVATKNALNALFDLSIPPDVLVHLACQAEYGTGVRAGSLDQATEQKGSAGQGTLISSNPADNYRILGTYPVPAERFRVIFPYSVERDRTAWRWSWGMYGETVAAATSPDDDGAQPAVLTAGEWRKITGKAAEIAALLTRLPLDVDFFKQIETDLLQDGQLSLDNRRWIASILRELPLCIRRHELWTRLSAERAWYISELQRVRCLDAHIAATKADSTLAGLFAGWRDPLFPHPIKAAHGAGDTIPPGVPLRAIVAYLFSEVAKNFHLIHHPGEWIGCVTRSQLGDRSVAIDPCRLPDGTQMIDELPWEAGLSGPEKLSAWLERHGVGAHDFNRDLGDAMLEGSEPPEFHRWTGGSFFRGLALIDLAEAMLKRAFGDEAVAVRVNAAGQGDYFQVHIDTDQADPGRVKNFLRRAFYRRFGLNADPEFVETTPGGGAVGVRLTRYGAIRELVQRLRTGL